MVASFRKHILQFKIPAGTSRGVLTEKETYFLFLQEEGKVGVGECGLLRTLSFDDRPDYEQKLRWLCDHIQEDISFLLSELWEFPSICFGLEQAFRSLQADHPFELFPSDFTLGASSIPINGLIWMGEVNEMKRQVEQKIRDGFSCLKMKIGAIDFNEELSVLKKIRSSFSSREISLRVDANGAFSPDKAMFFLDKLSSLDIHSMEQPIKAGQWEAMAELCQSSPIPIALDEELIGILHSEEKERLLDLISPQYIILKPSLLGGYAACEEWMSMADLRGISYWVTSALESNVGLNAIAQWTYTLNHTIPQGLGTGSLYTNNIESPLVVSQGNLWYKTNGSWSSVR